jgi:hypothetical protein
MRPQSPKSFGILNEAKQKSISHACVLHELIKRVVLPVVIVFTKQKQAKNALEGILYWIRSIAAIA